MSGCLIVGAQALPQHLLSALAVDALQTPTGISYKSTRYDLVNTTLDRAGDC